MAGPSTEIVSPSRELEWALICEQAYHDPRHQIYDRSLLNYNVETLKLKLISIKNHRTIKIIQNSSNSIKYHHLINKNTYRD